MYVYVKGELTIGDRVKEISFAVCAMSSLHGLRKAERHIAMAYGAWPDSVESSTRQPYTSLNHCFPLVTINNKGIMQGLPYIHHRPTVLHHIA